MPSAGTLWINIAANTTRLSKGLRGARASMARWNKFIIAGAATTTVALGRTFEGINQSMTRSLAIMGDVSGDMRDQLTRAAVQVSKATQFSAKQAGEAYFFLASAGLDAQQSLKAMPQVAKFAQAGNFDLALATDLATDAQSALGMSSKDAATNLANMTRVTDVLVKANTLANASVQQFSEALTNKAGASLKVVGKDIEEGVAVLAAFADQGVKSSDAGSAMSIVFRELQTKALKNASAFREMGVAVFDARGEMRNTADIIGDLERRLGGMSDAQKKATLLQLGFNDKSVQFIQVLLGTSDKIRGYEKALRSAAGTTDMVADKSLTNMQKAVNRLRGAWEEMSVAVGPFLTDAVSSFADWLTAIDDANSGMSRLSSAAAVMADVIHTVKLGWLGMQAAFDSYMSAVIGRIESFITSTLRQLNRLPGVTAIEPVGLQVAAVQAELAARKSRNAFSEALIGKTPSENIKKFFEKVQREAEQTQKAVAKTIETAVLPPKVFDLFQKIGGGIASASGAITGAFGAGLKAAAASVGAGGSGLTPALNLTRAGTAESYRQRVAISRQDQQSKVAKNHFKEAKKQTNLLDLINRGLNAATPSNIFG